MPYPGATPPFDPRRRTAAVAAAWVLGVAYRLAFVLLLSGVGFPTGLAEETSEFEKEVLREVVGCSTLFSTPRPKPDSPAPEAVPLSARWCRRHAPAAAFRVPHANNSLPNGLPAPLRC